MKNKSWLQLLIALLAMLFVVGCGSPSNAPDTGDSGDSNEVEVVEEPTNEPAPEPTETPEPVVVEALVCDDAIGCVEVSAGDAIKLASALVVTGPNESLGLDSQYGVEIAIADRGDMFGHEVTLQAEDDGCSAEGGQTAGQKIVSDPSIVAVVGTSCSGAGVPMSQIVCDSGIAMVSPSNTAPVLTGEDTRQACYFRTAHNDKIQGKAMADFVFNELGITKAAAIHDGDPYTEGLASVFRDSFTANGGEIVAFEAEASDATNVEPLLTSVAAAGPELIYYPVFIPLGSLLTKTAQEIDGLDGVVLAAADGVLSPDFIDAAGDAAEGMYMSGPDLGFGNSIYDAFLATYEAEYGTEPTAPFHAHAYDATNMILDAIAAVAQVDADGNMLIGRQALIDAIGSTSGMAGITGTLSCDEFGDCADARIAVNQIQNGEFVPVAGAADTMDGGMMADGGCHIDAPADAVEINMLGWSFPITDFYAEELNKCNEVENLTVNTNLLASTDAQEQAKLVLSTGGDSLDIVHGANGQVAEWGSAGWLMPLNDMVEKYWDEYNLGDIPATAWEGATFDGNIYGVPIVGNTLHLIYNQDLLDEFGIDTVPTNYPEMIEMCNAIGLDNPDIDMPFTVNLSAGWAWEIEFFAMIRAMGGDFIDSEGNVMFNSDEGVAAAQMLKDVADACMGEAGYSFALNDQEIAMQLGTLPMTQMWASRAANMTDPERTDLGDVIGYAPAPAAMAGGPGTGTAWNDFYMIPAGAANDAEMIFKLIMEAADEESQAGAAATGMAARVSAAQFGGPYQPAAVQSIADGIGIYPKHPANAVARAKLGEFLPLIGTGEMTAEEALNAAAEAYTEEVEAQGLLGAIGDDGDMGEMMEGAEGSLDCMVEAPADATEINMLGWSFPITDFYAEELNKCNEVDNLTVNTNLLASTDAQEQAKLVLSTGGDSLDIVHGANGQVGEWGSAGWLMPLNDMVEKYWDEYNLGDIPQTAWDGATFEGNIYGVPIVGNTLHIIYNSDILAAEGIDTIPTTYPEIIEMCNTIGLDNPDYDMPFTVNLSAGWAWEIEFFAMLGSFGGQFLGDDNMPTFNGEEGVSAAQMLKDVADACMGEAGYSFALNDQEVAMQLGTLPMTQMWASRAANMTDPERTDLGDVIDYAPAAAAMAGLPGTGTAWNDYYMIPAGAANDAELIFKLIMDAADMASQAAAAETGMAARTSAAQFGGPYQPAAVQSIADGIGIYQKNPAVAIVRAKLGEFLPLIGTGEMTPEEALNAAAEAYIEEATAQGLIDG
ncbi:MAG: extracellular solute-binding protein [Candidatus Promineifilaceae bacterium]